MCAVHCLTQGQGWQGYIYIYTTRSYLTPLLIDSNDASIIDKMQTFTNIDYTNLVHPHLLIDCRGFDTNPRVE